MNRTIKFRVWDKDEKILVYDINLLSSSKHQSSWISDNGSGFFANPTSAMFDVMQFTGLLDKNGTEIYQGDIVTDTPENFKNYGNKISEIYEVKYEPNFAGWLPFVYHGGNEPTLEDCEIIGNIYENPELLNESTGSSEKV